MLSLDYFAFHFDNPKLSVAFSLAAFPSITSSGRYRIELDATIDRELAFDIYWGLNLYWAFDSDPTGVGAVRDDVSLSASLAWKP